MHGSSSRSRDLSMQQEALAKKAPEFEAQRLQRYNNQVNLVTCFLPVFYLF